MAKNPLALYAIRGFSRDKDDVLYAEQKGFDEVWVAAAALERDSITNAAAYAVATKTMTVGTAVTPMWGRNPALMAAACGSLWEIAPNRIKFGLGAWWEPLASQVGVKRRKNLTVMKEIVINIRKLLNLETITFKGEHVNFNNLVMSFYTKDPEKRPVPLYVGATGFKMCEVAGEVGDGVVLNYMVSPSYIQKCVEHVKIGAEHAGRKLEDIDRPELVAVSLDEDRDKALDAGRIMLTEYLGREPHIMKASGVSQEVLDKVHEVLPFPYTPEQVKKASKLVPDETVQQIVAAGTPEECKKKVREYIKAGTTMPIIYPVLKNAKEVVDAFADGYM